jgi:hypothetical protein
MQFNFAFNFFQNLWKIDLTSDEKKCIRCPPDFSYVLKKIELDFGLPFLSSAFQTTTTTTTTMTSTQQKALEQECDMMRCVLDDESRWALRTSIMIKYGIKAGTLLPGDKKPETGPATPAFKLVKVDEEEEEEEEEDKKKPAKVVRGSYCSEIVWKIPEGIDLTDKETYQYEDVWGVLWITNKKTGEIIQVEGDMFEHDQKRCDKLELCDADSDADDE